MCRMLLVRASEGRADAWPTLHRDNQRSGFSSTVLKGPFEQKWFRDFHDEMIATRCEAIVAEDKVFVGTFAGKLHALSVASGETAWDFQAEGRIGHSPCYCNGQILFGTDAAFNCGYVYSLAAADGALRWKPTDQTFFAFKLDDGTEPFVPPVLFVATGLHNPPTPPTFNPQTGALYTWYASNLSSYSVGVPAAVQRLGQLDAATGTITSIAYAEREQFGAGEFAPPSDESQALSLMGNVIVNTHQGVVIGMDLDSKQWTRFYAARDSYGGIFGPLRVGGWTPPRSNPSSSLVKCAQFSSLPIIYPPFFLPSPFACKTSIQSQRQQTFPPTTWPQNIHYSFRRRLPNERPRPIRCFATTLRRRCRVSRTLPRMC